MFNFAYSLKAHLNSLLNAFLRSQKRSRIIRLVQDLLANLNSSNFILAAFIFGVSINLCLETLFSESLLAVCTLVLGLVALKHRYLLPIFAFSAGLLSATLFFQRHIDNTLPSNWERQDLSLRIEVLGLPQRRVNDVHFRAHVVSPPAPPELAYLQGKKLQLSCYRCSLDIQAGDVWQTTVRLKQAHGYASPGAFDYEKYLFRQRVIAKGYIRLKHAEHQKLSSNQFDIDHWRTQIKASINKSLPNGSVGRSVIEALSIGDKSGFSNAQREVLQQSGLSHLFAISGLHIGLMFALGIFVFKHIWNVIPGLYERIPRPYLCLAPALMLAVLYSAMAGFSVSTQRALIMLSVFVVMRLLCRDTGLLKVLLIAASLILLLDPFAVLDGGFWLSFGAVFTIACTASNNEPVRLIRLQTALWLGMLPLSLILFGYVSLISPLVNLFAVPLFCVILIPITLFSVLLLVFKLDHVAAPIINSLEFCFNKIFVLLEWLVAKPHVGLSIPSIPKWYLLGIIALIFIAFFMRQRKLIRIVLIWPLLLLSLLGIAGTEPNKGKVRVTLLDVGQGLSLVIQTQSGVTVYDTGPKYSSGFTAASAVLIPYLRKQGIDKIDRLIISHADNDHIGGYHALSNAIPIQTVLTSRTDKLPDASECEAGQSWDENDTRFVVIGPQEGTPTGSNNRSCVLMLDHLGVRVLLTGDIEKKVERFLLNQALSLKADILLVPHQGSKTSSTTEFLHAVDPKLALVAAGYRNHYGHPNSAVLQRYQRRGVKVLSTIESGTIEIELKEGKYNVNEYRKRNRRFWHWQEPPT